MHVLGVSMIIKTIFIVRSSLHYMIAKIVQNSAKSNRDCNLWCSLLHFSNEIMKHFAKLHCAIALLKFFWRRAEKKKNSQWRNYNYALFLLPSIHCGYFVNTVCGECCNEGYCFVGVEFVVFGAVTSSVISECKKFKGNLHNLLSFQVN